MALSAGALGEQGVECAAELALQRDALSLAFFQRRDAEDAEVGTTRSPGIASDSRVQSSARSSAASASLG